MEIHKAIWRAIIAEWNATVNGSLVTTSLVVLSAVLAILTAIYRGQFPAWPAEAAGSTTIAFVILSVPWSIYRVAFRERVARIKAEEERQALEQRPVTVKQAAAILIKEMRELLNSVPDSASFNEQCALIFDVFNERFWKRFEAIKDRMKLLAGPNGISPPAHWLPTNKENLRNMIDTFETETFHYASDDIFL